VSSCVTPSTLSFVMGLYSLLSSAVHFCPNGYACGNVWKPATLLVCIIHSDDGRAIGYSWLDGLLRNPRSGVQTPQVLGYSGLRVAEPFVRGSNLRVLESPSAVGDSGPTCPIRVHLVVDFRESGYMRLIGI
jgi:hypothetical protein